MITQTSEEHSEKEMIDLRDESHITLNNLRLFKREKAPQDRDDMMSVSVSSKVQKTWPRKRFQSKDDLSR